MKFLVWTGILFCLSQSAMLPGMNLGIFALSRLELKIESQKGNNNADKILNLRKNSNFTLVTILWGNIGVNVLLALLSDSIMNGFLGFIFSTVIITIFAEIIPQAYFSRYSLKLVGLLSPILLVYQFILFPVAAPSAYLLNLILGGEKIRYFKEKDMRQILKLHMDSNLTDIGQVEGQGTLNFLEFDDVLLYEEGEPVDPESIIKLEFQNDLPIFPSIQPTAQDSFLRLINFPKKSWVVIVDPQNDPRYVLRADDFIREAIFSHSTFDPLNHCHRPILTKDSHKTLGEMISNFKIKARNLDDDIIEKDIILVWGEQPRILTGSDILGRLLRGITKIESQ